MRCDYAQHDGAYVLGALAPAERAEYERHLGTCADCHRAVAELAALPGLLSRLDPAMAETVAAEDDPGPAPDTLLPRLLAAAHAERATAGAGLDGDGAPAPVPLEPRRLRAARRWRVTLAAAAAAVVLTLAGIGLGARLATPHGAPLLAMSPVRAGLPVSAQLRLVSEPWGTRVEMWCQYRPKAGPAVYPAPRWVYTLVAVPRAGGAVQLSTWTVAAGEPDPHITATVQYRPDQLDRIELRRDDGTPLLESRL